MKYVLTSIILSLLCLISFSQKIDGVGKFRIDKTNISIISSIEKEIKQECGITNKLEFYSNKERMTFDEILLESSEIRLFYLSEYTLSKIKLMDLYFVFYKDYLIELRCDKNKELDLFLTRKHGRPIIEQKTISNIKNLNLVYDEYVSKYTWHNNNIIIISFEKKTEF